MHKMIYGSRTAIFVFSSVFASFAIFDITSLNDSKVTIALIVLLIGGTIIIVKGMNKLEPEIKRRLGVLQSSCQHIELSSKREGKGGGDNSVRLSSDNAAASDVAEEYSTTNPILK